MKILTMFLTPILWVVFLSFHVPTLAEDYEERVKEVVCGVQTSDGVTPLEDAVSMRNHYLVVGAPFVEAVDLSAEELGIKPEDKHYSVAGSQWLKQVWQGDAVEYVPVTDGELVEPDTRYRFIITVKSEGGWRFEEGSPIICTVYGRIGEVFETAELRPSENTKQLDMTFNYESRPKMEWVNIQFAPLKDGDQESWEPISVETSDGVEYEISAEDFESDGLRALYFSVNTDTCVASVIVGSTKLTINGEEQPLYISTYADWNIAKERIGQFTSFYGSDQEELYGLWVYAQGSTALPSLMPGRVSSAPAYDLAGRRVIAPSRGVPFVKDGKLVVVK